MEISEDISIGEKQELYSDVVSINNLFNENDRRTNTNLLEKVVFAMGHVLNDICASMWFTYIILYFEYVLKLGAIYASYVFLIGQITDAITTPIAGILSDKFNGFRKYGKRKSVHLIGTGIVCVSFIFIFVGCLSCHNITKLGSLFFYIPIVMLFQIGWAIVQVSHLALLSDLSRNKRDSIIFNSIRFGFTVFSNILVFLVNFLFINQSNDKNIISSYKTLFRITSLILVSIGLFFVIIFHVFTKENKYTHVSINQILTHSCEDSFKLKLIKCFKFPKFYGVIVIYTFTRLVFNCLQIYVPTFILSIHTLPKTFITLVPLIIFCSCFLSSLIIKKISKYIGSMSTFYFGAIIIATGNIFILSNNIYKVWNWVIISILTGVGSSTMLILSLAQITSFSDELKKISAFIIGCASFSDKLFNGLVVHVIQNIKSNVSEERTLSFYKFILSIVLGVLVFFAVLSSITMQFVQYYQFYKKTRKAYVTVL